MKSAFWRVIALASIAVLIPSMAFAGGEVSRSAMAGTNFMNTSADTWVLFHRSMDGEGFAEFVSQDYYTASVDTIGSSEGFGRLILPLGDYRLGLEVNDGATGSNLVDYAANGGPYIRAFTIGNFIDDVGTTGFNGFLGGQFVSAKLAGQLGDGPGGWSAGLGYYSNGVDDNENDIKDNSGGWTLNGSWGRGAPGADGTIEVAAEYTMHSDKHEETGADEELSGMHFAADGRWSLSDNSHFEGALIYLTSDFETTGGTDSYGLTAFKLTYVRDLIEDADRGANVEVGFDWADISFEPEGGAEQSAGSIGFPAARFSGWNQLGNHFKLYGGVANAWYTDSFESPDAAVDESSTGDSFYWTLGLGWDPNENIAVEFFLLTDNISDFATLGSSTPLIGGVGAHASW